MLYDRNVLSLPPQSCSSLGQQWFTRTHTHTHARAQVTDPNKAAAKGNIDLLRGLTAAQLSAAKDLRGWR
jgi:hypothetical protein